VLSAVFLLATAASSLKADASLEELKSINHHLLGIQTAIEGLPRR
jgi:hypothetical protein